MRLFLLVVLVGTQLLRNHPRRKTFSRMVWYREYNDLTPSIEWRPGFLGANHRGVKHADRTHPDVGAKIWSVLGDTGVQPPDQSLLKKAAAGPVQRRSSRGGGGGGGGRMEDNGSTVVYFGGF